MIMGNLQNKEIYKEENGMVFQVKMNEHSTLVTKITKKDTVVYDDSNYLLIGNCEKSTLIIRCSSIEEADKKYDELKETKEKMLFNIRQNKRLCSGGCLNCPVYEHPLNQQHPDLEDVYDKDVDDEDLYDFEEEDDEDLPF